MGIGDWWNDNIATPIGNKTAAFVQGTDDFFSRDVYLLQNPSELTKEIATTVTKATTGGGSYHGIPAVTAEQQAKSSFSVGDVISFPVAAVSGTVAGTVAGVASSFLGEDSKAAKLVQEHPIATTAAIAAVVLAPTTVIALVRSFAAGAENLVKDVVPDKKATAPQAVAPQQAPQPVPPQPVPPAKPPAKPKKKAKAKPKKKAKAKPKKKAKAKPKKKAKASKKRKR